MAEDTRRKRVGDELLRRIALGQQTGITRADVLDGSRNRTGAARRLGKLIKEKKVAEDLTLWQTGEAIGLRVSSLVTLQLDTVGMRHDKSPAVSPRKRSTSTQPANSPLPAQELVIFALLSETRRWLKDHDEAFGVPRLVVLDACIVYGGTFDVMVSVVAREPRDVLRWVAEVASFTRHVKATQTLQIAYRHSARADRDRFQREQPEYRALIGRLEAYGRSRPTTKKRERRSTVSKRSAKGGRR